MFRNHGIFQCPKLYILYFRTSSVKHEPNKTSSVKCKREKFTTGPPYKQEDRVKKLLNTHIIIIINQFLIYKSSKFRLHSQTQSLNTSRLGVDAVSPCILLLVALWKREVKCSIQ